MDDDRDADALSWAGETDPTHADTPEAEPRVRARRVRIPRVTTPPGTSSALLVCYGVLAGVYLLYIIGWFAAVVRNTLTLPSLIPEIMYQLGEFLAIVAPGLWFGAALFFTRNSRPVIRVLWLVVGLALLVPWPVIVGR